MTVPAADPGLYALGLLLLRPTPGPIWVAATARALSGGFRAAWPLAVGVTLGDLLLALLVGRAGAFLSSPDAVRRSNLVAGSLLVAVGLLTPCVRPREG